MTSRWYNDAIISIFSRTKAILLDKYKTKYPDFNVTDDDSFLDSAKFPTVYIHSKQDDRTDNLEQNMIESTGTSFTIHVLVKNSNTQGKILCDDIMCDVVDIFKSIGFRAPKMPEIQNMNKDTKREIAYFKRAIDMNDTF